MSDSPKRIGVAADHGGFESEEYLAGVLREAHYEVVDYGDSQPKPDDEYPDSVVPLARAVARGEVDRGGASAVVASVVYCRQQGATCAGVLIHEGFSTHQGGRGRRHECDLPWRPRGREYVLGSWSEYFSKRDSAAPSVTPSCGQSRKAGIQGGRMRQSICLDYFRRDQVASGRFGSRRTDSAKTSSCERQSRTAVGDLRPLCDPMT